MNQYKDYIILAPMIPMIIHIYEFFEVDHFIIRVMIALTFDLTLFLLFKFLRVDKLQHDKQAMNTVWTAIGIMTFFQLYANIRVYWNAEPGPDAVMRGSIFPLMFAFLSWITTRLDTIEVEKEEQPKQIQEVQPVEDDKPPAIPAADLDQRELCENLFTEIETRTEAVKAAQDAGVPKSTSYRYYREFLKEGSLT